MNLNIWTVIIMIGMLVGCSSPSAPSSSDKDHYTPEELSTQSRQSD